MTKHEALSRMIAPGTPRPGSYRNGIIQIHLTRACDRACFNCTQGSNLRGKTYFLSLADFELACKSLAGYWGVVGIFGGSPTLHPQFGAICDIFRRHFPNVQQRGLWTNNLHGQGMVCRETFFARHSNLNVHLDRAAFEEFRRDWPESIVFGVNEDSRHSPPWVAMQDVISDEAQRWDLIARCDINQHWSALVRVVPGKGLRGYFCEIAYAQAALHADDPDWPDAGIAILEDGTSEVPYVVDGTTFRDAPEPLPPPPPRSGEGEQEGGFAPSPLRGGGRGRGCGDPLTIRGLWWQQPMRFFAEQVRWHCHRCGVPLRGHGELAVSNHEGTEQVSATHADVYRPKDKNRRVELVTVREQLGRPLRTMVDYLGNGARAAERKGQPVSISIDVRE